LSQPVRKRCGFGSTGARRLSKISALPLRKCDETPSAQDASISTRLKRASRLDGALRAAQAGNAKATPADVSVQTTGWLIASDFAQVFVVVLAPIDYSLSRSQALPFGAAPATSDRHVW
jgi:hypothetical protein